jgi:YVTN family beta-propeller protein
MAVQISILGTVEATREGDPVDLGSPQQRAVLALLAIDAGRPVSVDRIVDALWPDNPPPTAGKTIQTYVSRLRRALGDEAIERRGNSYILRAEVDVERVDALVAQRRFADALALWRGRALADVPGLHDERERLEELHLRTLEDRIDEDLAEGNDPALLGELRSLAAAHPLRERLLGQLMVGLYGAGRQAEALAVYRDARKRFHDQLGLEPGPTLKELERRILAHDPTLRAAPPPPSVPVAVRARVRRHLVPLVVTLTALVLVCVGLIASFPTKDAPAHPIPAMPNSIARIDPATNSVVEDIRVGRHPGAIAADGRYVWVVNDDDKTLSRFDTRTGQVQTIGGLPYVGLVALDGRGNVYVSGFDDPLVWQIDPHRLKIIRHYRVRSRAVGMAVGGGSLWVVDRLVNAITRIDLRTGKVAQTIPVGADPLFATFGYGTLWVTNSDDGTVSSIRPGVSKPDTITVDSRPFGIAAGERGVWVVGHTWSTVTRIDSDTRRVVKEIELAPKSPFSIDSFAVATGAGGVWTTNWTSLSVIRIDPRTNRVVARIKLRGSPTGIAVSGDQVWVAVVAPGTA